MYIGHSDEGQRLLSIEHLYHYQLYTRATRNVRAIPQATRRQQKTNEMERQHNGINARQQDGMEGKTDAQFTAYLSLTENETPLLHYSIYFYGRTTYIVITAKPQHETSIRMHRSGSTTLYITNIKEL